MNRPLATADHSDSRWAIALAHGDMLERMAEADHADWVLLRLVCCAAGATLLLAVASSFGL